MSGHVSTPPGFEQAVPVPINHLPPPPPNVPLKGLSDVVVVKNDQHQYSNGGKSDDSHIHDLSSYVYNVGFIHAAWADTFVSLPRQPPLRLHALFASRSPLLYRYLSNYMPQGPPYHININSDDRNLTNVSVSMALATLYGHNLDQTTGIDFDTAKGLLAAGSLFGLEAVASFGFQSIINLISKQNLSDLFNFALNLDNVESTANNLPENRSNSGPGSPYMGSPASLNGTASISSPSVVPQPNSSISSVSSSPLTSFEDIQITHQGPYPPFTQHLVSILIDFILNNFNASEKPLDPVFKSVILSLPFHLFKGICESEQLDVKTQMERHSFAREMTALRENNRRKKLASGALNPSSPIYEENVVLAFGGGKGGVSVIRKLAGKKKSLWKAGH